MSSGGSKASDGGSQRASRRRSTGASASREPKTGEVTELEVASRGLRGRTRRRLRARKVDRIIRRIDPWSVLKLAFLFYLCLWLILLFAGIILWTAAVSAGAIDNVEDFVTELFGLESFEFRGDQIFRGAAFGGVILVLVGTGFSVLLSVLFNLIGDLTGGIRVSVIELENLRRRQQPPADTGAGGRADAGGDAGAEAARQRGSPAPDRSRTGPVDS